jgi:glutamine cyclotransferase
MKKIICQTLLVLTLLNFVCCRGDNTQKENSIISPPEISIPYSVINVYPHDTSCYTQGLILYENALFESTGLYTKSRVRKINKLNGQVIKEIKISDEHVFGEGITIFNNRIYQLTWESNKAYSYDVKSFALLKEFAWPYEGWGITHNDTSLIISTGTENVYFVDPVSFKVQKTIKVFDQYGYVKGLNELEFINGFLFANQYLTDNILKIDIRTGKVAGLLDMKGLLVKSGIPYEAEKYGNATGNVLNGIAYDPVKKSLLVTGKLWPALFEIKF